MKSIKAIVYGSAFIVITMLFLQLGFIFVAVGYNYLAADFQFLKDISGVFRYLVGIPLFIATLFLGGYITAATIEAKSITSILLHCLALGVITVGSMALYAMDYMSLTIAGIVIYLLALCSVVAGGYYWLIKQKSRRV